MWCVQDVVSQHKTLKKYRDSTSTLSKGLKALSKASRCVCTLNSMPTVWSIVLTYMHLVTQVAYFKYIHYNEKKKFPHTSYVMPLMSPLVRRLR